MDDSGLKPKLSQAEEAISMLQKELEETNRGLIALTMELERKNEEVRSMTQALWQAAKLATMGELAASIAHELNNPLATVSLRIESLQVGLPENDPRRLSLEIVEKEIDRMAHLVADLLQFSRRNQPQISTVDIREEIEKTLDLIAYHLRKCTITVRKEFASDVRSIPVDRQQLRQVFLNLFSNAADAMPQGGTLTVRVSMIESPAQVVAEVSDTGSGISPEVLPKITEPFFTTKPEGKGTGLGLPICRRIIQEHHGALRITSDLGRGTTVSLTLPVAGGKTTPIKD
jgi:signal transduction histidine kinase